MNKKLSILRVVSTLCLLGGLVGMAGCASMAIHGGSIVSQNDNYIKEFVVTYRAEGAIPPGQTYHLVRSENGLAVFEQGVDGSGVLFENQWTDSDNDHFSAWVYLPGGGPNQHGYEFVVPKDRSKNAIRYVYPGGTYVVKEIDGVKRPVPASPVEPVTKLIPNK